MTRPIGNGPASGSLQTGVAPSPATRRRFLTGLCLATILLFIGGDERLRREMIAESTPEGFDGTILHASPDRHTLHTMEIDPILWADPAQRARAANRPLHVRVIARVEANAGHTSDHPWSALVTLDAWNDEERLAWHVFSPIHPRQAVIQEAGTLLIPEEADRLTLRFHVRPGAGTFRFEAEPVRVIVRSSVYPTVVIATSLAWAVLAIALFACLWRRAGPLPTLAAFVTLTAVAIGVSVSEAAPLHGFQRIASWVASLGTRVPGGLLGLFKGGHLLVFLGVGLAAALCRRILSASLPETLIALLLLACASESVQRHLDDRTATITDVLIDLGGATLGLALGHVLLALRHPATPVPAGCRSAEHRPADQETRDRPAR